MVIRGIKFQAIILTHVGDRVSRVSSTGFSIYLFFSFPFDSFQQTIPQFDASEHLAYLFAK